MNFVEQLCNFFTVMQWATLQIQNTNEIEQVLYHIYCNDNEYEENKV
jgi:hypothetical protein